MAPERLRVLVAPRDVAEVRGRALPKKRAAAPKFGAGGERLLAPRVFAGMEMLRISQPGMRRRVRPPTPELPPERRMPCKKMKKKKKKKES